MEITVQYFEGCPNWRVAGQRLQAVLDAAGSRAPVMYVQVETDEEAERLQFHGSPTILIDGHDPFGGTGLTVGLACRVYQTPSGLAGSPTTEQLAAAIEERLRS